MPDMQPAASFKVLFSGSQPVTDVLGLWQPDNIADNGPTEGVFWRADLPAASDQAALSLEVHSRELQAARLALEAAPARLSYDLAQLALAGAQPGSADQIAFSLQATTAPAASNILQRAWLYRLDAASFGESVDPSEVDSATGVISSFSNQVQRLVGQLALVESSSAGWPHAFTRVAWSGDVDTWLAPAASADNHSQHRQVLAQALATRQAWLRFLLLFSAGVVRIGAALSTSAFFPLALWTTWKYLQQIVTEYRRLAAVSG